MQQGTKRDLCYSPMSTFQVPDTLYCVKTSAAKIRENTYYGGTPSKKQDVILACYF